MWPHRMFSDMSLESFVHANSYPDKAMELLNTFVHYLPFTTASATFRDSPSRNLIFPRSRLGKLEAGHMYTLNMSTPNKDETNSAVYNYFQVK